ncbi:hypothetical protein D7X33_45340 [Butyricicoccus sp. 1XD8-22]|nr:hypothetical protein D7X33_45340 [Butyricicoccus sp. 1XD8-22]
MIRQQRKARGWGYLAMMKKENEILFLCPIQKIKIWRNSSASCAGIHWIKLNKQTKHVRTGFIARYFLLQIVNNRVQLKVF